MVYVKMSCRCVCICVFRAQRQCENRVARIHSVKGAHGYTRPKVTCNMHGERMGAKKSFFFAEMNEILTFHKIRVCNRTACAHRLACV